MSETTRPDDGTEDFGERCRMTDSCECPDCMADDDEESEGLVTCVMSAMTHVTEVTGPTGCVCDDTPPPADAHGNGECERCGLLFTGLPRAAE